MRRALAIVLLVFAAAAISRAQIPSPLAGSQPQFTDADFHPPRRPPVYLFTLDAGDEEGFGFKFPHLAFGWGTELPIGKHFEAQGDANFSPDRKQFARSGFVVSGGALGIAWLLHRIGATAAERYSGYWTNKDAAGISLHKGGWSPSVGIVVRDGWYGDPGRFYLAYVFPTGCQWGTGCPIQSSRDHGFVFSQEFRFYTHWRFGVRGSVIRYADQSNQLAPQLGRVWHWTGDNAAFVRYEWQSNESY